MDEWFYKSSKVETGPITRDQLALLARQGVIRPVDEVRLGAAGLWTAPAHSMFDAQVIRSFGIEPRPEPPPDHNECGFYVDGPDAEVIGPLTGRGVRELVVDGTIPRESLVRHGMGGVWFVPSEEWFDLREETTVNPLRAFDYWLADAGDKARQQLDRLQIADARRRFWMRVALTAGFAASSAALFWLVVLIKGAIKAVSAAPP